MKVTPGEDRALGRAKTGYGRASQGQIVPFASEPELLRRIPASQARLDSLGTITEHKGSAIGEGEYSFSLLFNGITDMLTVLDTQYNVVKVNKATEQVFGQDVVGKKCYEAFRGRGGTCPDCPTAKALAIGRPAFSAEQVTPGRPTVELWAFPVKDRSGNITAVIEHARDITERKLAEEKLRAQTELIERVLASTPDAIIVLDREGRILLANRAFHEATAVAPGDVLGRQLSQVLPIAGLWEAVLKTFTTGESQANLEFRYDSPGRERTFMVQITPMRQQEVAQLLIGLRDVSIERGVREQLHHMEALASVGELAAGVAHELSNPLTAILGYSELLLSEEMSEKAKQDVETIQRNAQRAAQTLRNVLTFTRRQKLEKGRVNLRDLINQVLEMRSYQLRMNNIEVLVDWPSQVPDIMADPLHLEQVFLNIIVNAEQAMTAAHGRGTLTVKVVGKRDRVTVSFVDDGPGIPWGLLKRVFDPFFTTKGPGKGTGLGLSMCHGIVAEHGGRIYAESKEGKGAAFFVELPIRESEADCPS